MPNHIFSALLDALQEEYGALTQAQIAKALRVSVGTVHNWTNGGEPNKTNLKKLLDLFKNHQASTLIRPLLEFQEIEPYTSGGSWSFSRNATTITALKTKLDGKKGVYVFYDSSGKAIYLGKTEASLFIEAKQRLAAVPNRAIYLPIAAKVGAVGNRTQFISAYEVSIPAAIKNLETFMLRAFTNDLSNKNGGHFK